MTADLVNDSTGDALIQVRNLEKYYGRLHALKEISFDVDPGEFMSVIGPSGCGKTTLLKIVGGIVTPSSGQVLLRGSNVSIRRRQGGFGFVFQNPVLLPWRSLADNIKLPTEILGKKGTRSVADLLNLVGLAGFESAFPHQLSGGMQQRGALARALSFDPEVLLMDEPFGAVDELNREKLVFELLNIWETISTTILFVTHSIPEAVFVADRILLLSERPARVVRIIEVPLPRPRTSDTLASSEYLSCVGEVREALRNNQ